MEVTRLMARAEGVRRSPVVSPLGHQHDSGSVTKARMSGSSVRTNSTEELVDFVFPVLPSVRA